MKDLFYFDDITDVKWDHDDRVDALPREWTNKWGVLGTPAYAALVAMRETGHWRAKAMLDRKPHDIAKFTRRVFSGTRRTPFLDEVRQQVVKMRLKGEV